MSNNSKKYIGKIVNSRFPYYSVKTGCNAFKLRPVLIIGAEKETLPCDFNVLPVSTIKDRTKINPFFDYCLDYVKCSALGLRSCPSFIRVNKQSCIHSSDIKADIIADFLSVCHEDYEKVKRLHAQFTNNLFQIWNNIFKSPRPLHKILGLFIFYNWLIADVAAAKNTRIMM